MKTNPMRARENKNLTTDFHESIVEEDQGIDVTAFFRLFWAHKWFIVTMAALGYLIATFYAATLLPIYSTGALLKVEQKSQNVMGSEFASNVMGGNTMSSAEVILLKSDDILAAAIEELNHRYTVTPRYYRYIGASIAKRHGKKGLADPLLGLDKYAWGGEILDLDRFDVTEKLENVSTQWKLIAGENQEYDLLSRNGDLVLSGKVGTQISVEYQGSTIEIYVSQLLARPGVWFTINLPSRLASIKSLHGQLNVRPEGESGYRDTGIIRLSMSGPDPKRIADTVLAVARAYVKHNIDDQSQEAQQTLDFVEGQLPELKAKLDKAQRSLQEYRQKIETVDMEFETKSALTQLKDYEKEISELELKRDDLKQRFTESHPEVTVVSRQIARIQEKRKQVEEQLHALPEREWEFIQKTRDVELATQLYVVLLNKAQELRITKAGIVGNARIINLVTLEPQQIAPNRPRVRMIGLIMGLLLSIGLVYIWRLMHNKIVDPREIEGATGLHVYANIPHSPAELEIYTRAIKRKKKKLGKTRLLAFEKDTDFAIEAMRSFRTSMRFAMKTAENNIIIISGPSVAIGKSFFASNYAAVASKERQRVLLIDGDMRKGHLHHYMGKAIKPGLSELIANEVTLDEVVHQVADNFYFISSGDRPPNPAELLGSAEFQELSKHLQKHFDLVIFDTPPILTVTDASVIAQYGGQLFLLLRYDWHHINEVHAAISQFEKNGVHVTGLLFNDVDLTDRGYGYGYGYGYKYEDK